MDTASPGHIKNRIDLLKIIGFPALLLCIALVFFGDVLFFSSTKVVSKQGNDLFSFFVYLRDFGFSQLSAGNLALWNPHAYSGASHIGGFQSALFYPPNWIYLLLPLQKAFNADLAFHVLAAGIFMYLWCAYRGLSGFACFAGGILFMFSGAFFPHLYAGHLAPMATMTWSPLVILAIEGLIIRPNARWCLLGIFALSMQVLAGYPQIVFFTGVVAAVYVAVHVVRGKCGLRSIACMVAMCFGAVCLCAVQLFAGYEFGAESVRSSGLSYAEASIFSFAPENFMTLLAPGFFGIDGPVSYWGRCYFWEMCLYFGVIGLALSICGYFFGKKELRRFSLVTALVCLLLALGAHTPVYRFLYSYAPGFDMFRGQSKYIVAASLFLVMLAAIGLDSLLKRDGIKYKRISSAFLLSSLICASLALVIRSSAAAGESGAWAWFLTWVESSKEIYVPGIKYADPDFIVQTAKNASKGLFASSGFLAMAAGLVFLARRRKSAVYLLGVLAMAEILIFAWSVRPVFDITQTRVPALARFALENKGDYRVLNMTSPNSGVVHQMFDIWGYDPGMGKRYAEFIALTQGADPDKAGYGVKFTRYHDLLRILRCRYVITKDESGYIIKDYGSVMPRGLLIGDYQQVSGRDRIFAQMTEPGFDFHETVILESGPKPEPVKSAKGTVFITHESTDKMIIDVEIDKSAILLITDIYSCGWKARSVDPASDIQYKIMPANYILRAIALPSGQHSIAMEYKPSLFIYGKWISLVSVLLYGLFLYIIFIRPVALKLR